MSPETCEVILYILSSFALVVWISSFEFLRITANRIRESEAADIEQFGIDVDSDDLPKTGRVAIKGTPEELTSKLASSLATGANANLGPVELTRVDQRCVKFHSISASLGRGNRFGSMIGDIRFEPGKGGETEAVYRVKTPSAKGLMLAAWIVQSLGLVALIATFCLMRFFVVDHPSTAVRYQVLQCLQLIHFLWPPFLLGGLARMGQTVAERTTRAMLVNLPYV